MSEAARAYAIGPENGYMHLRTTREGLAAKVGHDLLIEVRSWSGRVTVNGAGPGGAHVAIQAEPGSLTILGGSGGATGLSAADRDDITATAKRLLEVDRYPQTTFSSGKVALAPGESGGTLRGTLTLLGQSRPIVLDVAAAGPGRWRATTTVLQSQFGIKPYRTFFGALRLSDVVTVEVCVDLPGT